MYFEPNFGFGLSFSINEKKNASPDLGNIYVRITNLRVFHFFLLGEVQSKTRVFAENVVDTAVSFLHLRADGGVRVDSRRFRTRILLLVCVPFDNLSWSLRVGVAW